MPAITSTFRSNELSGLEGVIKTFYPPFTKVDREEDYRRVWEEFSRLYGDAVSSDQLPVSSEKSA